MDCCIGMGAAQEFGEGYEEKNELHPRDFVAITEEDDVEVTRATLSCQPNAQLLVRSSTQTKR